MGVSNHHPLQRIVIIFQQLRVGQKQVDTRKAFIGKTDPAIDGQKLPVANVNIKVHAELFRPAKGNKIKATGWNIAHVTLAFGFRVFINFEQALQRQIIVNLVDKIRIFGKERRKTTCGDHEGFSPQLARNFFNQPLNQA